MAARLRQRHHLAPYPTSPLAQPPPRASPPPSQAGTPINTQVIANQATISDGRWPPKPHRRPLIARPPRPDAPSPSPPRPRLSDITSPSKTSTGAASKAATPCATPSRLTNVGTEHRHKPLLLEDTLAPPSPISSPETPEPHPLLVNVICLGGSCAFTRRKRSILTYTATVLPGLR
jgi:hypothetical protein